MNQIVPRKDLITSVSFSDLRLPYIDAFAEAFGVDNIRWKVLIDTVFPGAKTVDAVAMALSYCKQRNLDPFKRPVHIVPMYSSEKKAYVETVWPGISELRTTAARTTEYAGCDAAEFGPPVKRVFKGISEVWQNRQKVEQEITVSVDFPEWCQITVYRFVRGQRLPFVSPKVYWTESYARRGRADIPNDMWCKRPFGQLEKCAEAAGLRRAFPEEIGNEYAAEEMEGQTIFSAPIVVAEPPKAVPSPPRPTPPNPNKRASAPPQPQQEATTGFDFDKFRAALTNAATLEDANEVYEATVTRSPVPLDEDVLTECDSILREATARFWTEGGT